MSTIYLEELAETLLDQNTKTKMVEFLQAILTSKELDEIPKRLQIVKLLKRKIPQRIIAEKLKVGVATVTRGSKELQLGHFQDIQ